MDINLLSKMVRELILDNERVALPGVGTFVAVEMPASFSDRGFTINPPYRKLSFTADKADDSLIAGLYASSNGISVDQARLIVNKFILEMQEVLKTRKTVVFEGLGKLRATKDNTFFFVGDEDLDIYPEGYGLEPISLKSHVSALHQEALPEIKLEVPALRQAQGPEEVEQATEIVGPSTSSGTETGFGPSTGSGPETSSGTEAQLHPENYDVKERTVRPLVITLVVVLILVLFAAAAVAVLGRLAPDFIDPLLYSPEELEILRY